MEKKRSDKLNMKRSGSIRYRRTVIQMLVEIPGLRFHCSENSLRIPKKRSWLIRCINV